MLRGSSLKITQWVYGIVVYTGQETKIKQNDQNQSKARKKSAMESLMNLQILIVIAMQFFIVVLGGLAGYIFAEEERGKAKYLQLEEENYNSVIMAKFPALTILVRMGTWILLLTNFVPISLLVSVEMVKYFQALFIEWDAEMVCPYNGNSAVVQQSGLNEELGQVSYIFSDKTGTLTCNKMVFKQMSVKGKLYGNPKVSCLDQKQRAVTNFDMVSEPLQQIIDSADNNSAEYKDICDYLYHLALCHTIVSTRNPRCENEVILNASSPDELALVNAAKYYGINFFERVRDDIIISTEQQDDQIQTVLTDSQGRKLPGNHQKFQLLNVLEFTSQRKRMTIIVRTPDNRILVLSKGADSVLFPLLKNSCDEIVKSKTMSHL